MAARDFYICAFGRISVGKSALLNALMGRTAHETGARGGTTTEVRVTPWHTDELVWTSGHGLNIHLVDVPGLEEAQDAAHARLAHGQAAKSHLILFVTDGDLTDSEFQSLQTLADMGRPLLVVLNKTDVMNGTVRDAVRRNIVRRLHGFVRPDHVFVTAADPYGYAEVDGELQERALPANVTELRKALTEILRTEGAELAALPSFLERLNATETRATERKRLRESAEETMFNFAVAIAAGVAVNPLPFVDLVGGAAGVAVMVNELAKTYGVTITEAEAEKLAQELMGAGLVLLGATVAANVVASFIKGIPLLGWVGGAAIQAGAAGFFTLVLGATLIEYLENGKSWGESDAKQVMKEVLAGLDKQSITREILERVARRKGE